MAKQQPNPVQVIRERFRDAAKTSGLTQEEIGVKMGLTEKDARKAVSRLLNSKKHDPRLSTLLKLAEALGRPLRDFL